MHVDTLVPDSGAWDRVRKTDGTWAGSATQVDTNGTIKALTAVMMPDGSMHLETLVPGYGVSDHVVNANGTWASGTTNVDTNGTITALTAAVQTSGSTSTLHLDTLVPGHGVYDHTYAGGTWAPSTNSSTPTAQSPLSPRRDSITGLYAVGLTDGTMHVGTIA